MNNDTTRSALALVRVCDIVHKPRCKHRFTVYIKKLDDNLAQTKKDSNKPFEDTRPQELKDKYINKQKLNYYRNNKAKLKGKIRVYEALYRNKNRETRVPQSVIDKMYLSNYNVSE